jgi:prepilin-type N-terminal cleavage/methylation domain-containing protein
MVHGFTKFLLKSQRRQRGLRDGGFTLVELVLVVVIIAALASMVVLLVGDSRKDAEMTVAQADLRVVSDAVFGSGVGVGYLQDMKHVPGFRSVNLRVHDLFSPSSYSAFATFDPVANRGWRGPYLRSGGIFPASGDRRFAGDTTFLERNFYPATGPSRYAEIGDSCVKDPWGNPVVIQVPAPLAFTGAVDDAKRFRYVRLVSAGPDGELSTPLDRLAGRLVDSTAAARGDDLVLFPNRSDAYETE